MLAGHVQSKNVLLLIIIQAVVIVLVTSIALFSIYDIRRNDIHAALTDIVNVEKNLILIMSKRHGDDAVKIIETLRTYKFLPESIGRSGELVIGNPVGDKLVFLYRNERAAMNSPDELPLSKALSLAVPMRLALERKSGFVLAKDYKGTDVFAAYSYIDQLGWGIVAKIDASEVRAPFYRIAGFSVLLALVCIGIGSLLFIKVTNPMIAEIVYNENKFRSLFDNATDCIIIMDMEHHVLEANETACLMLGYSRNELLTMEHERLHAAECPLTHDNMLSNTNLNRFCRYEVDYRTKDGRIFPVEINAKIINYNQREVIICVARDISLRREAEAEIRTLNAELEQRVKDRTMQLENANRELESFAYSVSHDLRAPLRGIDGWSLALAEDYGDKLDEQALQYLQRVRSETHKMGQLIDDLLKLSRVTRRDMLVEKVNLSGLAETVAAKMRESWTGRQIEFLIQPDISVQGDPHLLEIVLTNLLDNACKFSGKQEQAVVEFGCEVIDGEPTLFVRDNGAGFDLAYAKNLFGAFQRMHKQSEFPGTGVGLATVQRIIHRHGGEIHVETSPGKGATFYFTIKETPSYEI